MADLASLPGKLRSFIDTRDRKSSSIVGYAKTPHLENFSRLLEGKVVRVGGRSSCGAKVDPSWVEFTAWNEIVRKAQGLGFEISVEPVKHGNGWATKARGFWNENDYRFKATSPDQPRGLLTEVGAV